MALWWKLAGRNKRTVVLDLKDAGRPGRAALGLVDDADVLVENFRPGTLERLGLGARRADRRNPTLVVTRVTGFGQDGPYAGRPGFATLAEAMSGFAAINGEPDGAPLLPPIALTDEVTGLVAAFATHGRPALGRRPGGRRQPARVAVPAHGPAGLSCGRCAGELQPRLGSGIPYSVPRGTYRCADGGWVGHLHVAPRRWPTG